MLNYLIMKLHRPRPLGVRPGISRGRHYTDGGKVGKACKK